MSVKLIVIVTIHLSCEYPRGIFLATSIATCVLSLSLPLSLFLSLSDPIDGLHVHTSLASNIVCSLTVTSLMM